MMTQVFIGPPTIINPLINQVNVFNKEISLNCEAKGYGTIMYRWQKFINDSWLDVIDGSNAEYKIDGLNKSSQFRCLVSNEAGKAMSTATILVLSKIMITLYG